MNILEKIDKLRRLKGWSVYKLAEKCDVTPSTLANIFARGTLPSLSTLMAICKGVDITLSEFFADDVQTKETQEERALLRNYRKLSKKNQEAITQLIKKVS